MKRLFQSFFFLLLLFSSCTQDLVQPVPATGDLVTVGLHISVAGLPSVMPATRGTGHVKHGAISVGYDLVEAAATRSDAARTEAEKALKSLWVLQFEGTAGGSTLIKKEDIAAGVQEGFAEVTLLANNAKNRVYLVANADVSAFSVGGTTLQNFEEGILTFAPCTEAELAERGLPMIAWADIDPRTDAPGTLMLQSMVTRLTLQCKVAQGLDCSIQSVTLHQVSEKVSVTPLVAGDAAVRPSGVTAADFTKSLEISGADKTATMVCYFPGNLAGRKTGLTEMWERTTANAPAEKAAYIKIVGMTRAGKSCFYTFYLGDGSATDFNVVGNRHYKLALTLQSADETDLRVETYFDLNPGGKTANCYLVYQNGESYGFDATARGNGAEDRSEPNFATIDFDGLPDLSSARSARVLWQTDGLASVIKNVQLQNGIIRLTTGTPTEGNAVIGLFDGTDGTGTCLWSWHIWKLTSAPADIDCIKNPSPASASANFKMMDRNLGAYNNTPDDINAFGLVYQWGRKDPFPGAGDYGSPYPEPTNIYGTYIKADNSTDTWNGTYSIQTVETSATYGTEAWAVKHPTVFITSPLTPSDWHYGSRNNCLWGNSRWLSDYTPSSGKKSIYDPCPVGYRVPPKDTWNKAEFATWGVQEKGSDIGGMTSSLYFPVTGARLSENGSFTGETKEGDYWSSSAHVKTSSDGCVFHFYIGDAMPATTENSRAYGNSVRCVSESVSE